MARNGDDRVTRLANAQAAAIMAREQLEHIDLRTVPKPLRGEIKEARERATELSERIHDAFVGEARVSAGELV